MLSGPPELDLSKIAADAEAREDENLLFRDFLKGKDSRSLDQTVHQLNAEVSGLIDCTRCGNCCRSMMVFPEEKDISRLAGHLHVSPGEFEERYLEKSQQGKFIFGHIPCSFLKDDQCTVYEARPEDCRSFPHLHKDGFSNRLFSVMRNYAVCPIVYNVVEQLKEQLGFTD